MDYQINPAALGAVFMVPCQVVDQHIKLAGAVQLKVLLWVMRHVGQPISVDAIAAALSLPAMDVTDALTYWVEAGLMQSLRPADTPETAVAGDAQAPNNRAGGTVSSAGQAARRPARPAPAQTVKPGREDVAKRGLSPRKSPSCSRRPR